MKMQTTGRILLHGLFRRWDLFVYLNLAILGTILVGSWLWPPSYQASSSIVILGRTYADLLTPPKAAGPSTLIMNPKEEINSEIEIIRSRPVLTRVVQDLHLDKHRTIPDHGISGAIRSGMRATIRGMIARIRLKGGRRVQKTTGKRQKVALAVAALLVPVCVVAWMLTLWRIGADLGITGGFGISSGILSHWQVWVGIASVLQVTVIALNRYGRSGR